MINNTIISSHHSSLSRHHPSINRKVLPSTFDFTPFLKHRDHQHHRKLSTDMHEPPEPAAGSEIDPRYGVEKRLVPTVSALVALCAKHGRKVSRRNYYASETADDHHSKVPPRSPLRSPKQLITTISNGAIPFIYSRKPADDQSEEADTGKKISGEGFGEDGLWQKTILMGEKCQPPEFPGVIYYDSCGNQISELPPRSPRASPLPSFSFPVVNDEP
ncbi:hypothetical protein F0562_032781 [Nyssa sinensis]|uniref:Uncharacterized protein n=1 Tax=Nyssa sinensis TaxID=561372 RepID=A0A5J5AR85_9ASTE|nr:hypothetical protein F0562_032781 [Nyssa sinensis]